MTDDNTGRRIDRRTTLRALAGTAVGATAFASGASASDFRQVNFCGCSQVCFTGGDPSDYIVWVGYRDDGEWTYEKSTVRIDNGEGGLCYTAEEAEADLGLDDDAEAKLVAVTDFLGRYVGNPTPCARNPLDALVDDPPTASGVPDFDGFVNDTAGGSTLALQFGTYSGITIVRGRCGTPGKDDPSNGRGRGNGRENGRGRGNGQENGRGP